MANPICPEHGLEAAVKSNVRNKATGRLYPPFYGCPWTGTDEMGARIYCKHRFEEKPTVSSMANAIQTGSAAAQSNKDQQIKYMNALNCAATLLAGQTIDMVAFEALADQIYKMNAKADRTVA